MTSAWPPTEGPGLAAVLVTAARAGIENLTPAELAHELATRDVLVLDVREPGEALPGELGSGELGRGGLWPGTAAVPRGLLEFAADPASPHHLPGLRPERRVVIVSGTGARSALAAARLQELGFRDVAHLAGGVAGWVGADG